MHRASKRVFVNEGIRLGNSLMNRGESYFSAGTAWPRDPRPSLHYRGAQHASSQPVLEGERVFANPRFDPSIISSVAALSYPLFSSCYFSALVEEKGIRDAGLARSGSSPELALRVPPSFWSAAPYFSPLAASLQMLCFSRGFKLGFSEVAAWG